MCQSIPELLALEPRDKACERVANAFPGCRCEAETIVPGLSPGPVGNKEILARFVTTEYWDEQTGKVKSAAFAHAGTVGMSVTRLDHRSEEELKMQERSKDGEPEPRRYVGYLLARCEDIRQIRSDGPQAFGTYDTAQRDNPAHADVCQAQAIRARSKGSELRRALQRAFWPDLITTRPKAPG